MLSYHKPSMPVYITNGLFNVLYNAGFFFSQPKVFQTQTKKINVVDDNLLCAFLLMLLERGKKIKGIRALPW